MTNAKCLKTTSNENERLACAQIVLAAATVQGNDFKK